MAINRGKFDDCTSSNFKGVKAYFLVNVHTYKQSCPLYVVEKHCNAGVGNCFGLRAAPRSRKLAEGRTFLKNALVYYSN